MKLAQYIKDKGLTDTSFGEKVGLSQSQINRIRRGEAKPTFAVVVKIHDETDGEVSFADFLDVSENAENAA